MASSRTARLLGLLWFRARRREGPELPPGPCLILLNHPNGLLDPLAAAALLERRAGWLAKATLWKLAPLRPFLAAFRVIPVTRPKDGGATPESIQQSFRQVHAVLGRGGSVAMFPEGVSHTGADLAPLKTGAARIALSSPVPLALIPAGLVYGDRGAFRHSVLLKLGTPIPFEDLAGFADLGGPGAVLELTARIRAALKPLTLHDADARRLALAQQAAWLLAEAPGSRVDLAALQARVQALLPHLAALPETEFTRVEDRVAEAQAWLRAKGLRPDQVGHPYPLAEVGRWLPGAALRLGLALLLLPAALLYAPPYLVVDWAARRFAMEGDLTATLKLLGGVLLHPLWGALLAGLAAWRWGWPWALVPPVALLLLVLALPLLERVGEDLQAIRGFLRRRDPAVADLLEARRQLLAAFPELGH
jgi:1-acyl-sn-glycerol-3-phosphate acyltransferase